MFGLSRIIIVLAGVLCAGVAAVVHMPGTPNQERVRWSEFDAGGRSVEVPDGFALIDPFQVTSRYLGFVWSHFAPPADTAVCLLIHRDEPVELFLYDAPKDGFLPLVEAALGRYDEHLNVTRDPPRTITTRDGRSMACHVVRRTDPVHPEGNVTLLLATADLGDRVLVANGGGQDGFVDLETLLKVLESVDTGA